MDANKNHDANKLSHCSAERGGKGSIRGSTHQVPGLKQGHPVQVNAQEARDGNKLDKDTARNRCTVGLHVGTHKDDGKVDKVKAVEDSAAEDCGNAYFRNKELIMNATGSATKA